MPLAGLPRRLRARGRAGGDGIAQSAFQTCTVTLGVDGGTAAQVAIRYNTCGR